MNNFWSEIFTYLVIESVLSVAFAIFIFFVTTRTRSEISRRWIASLLFSLFAGITVYILFIVLFGINWLMITKDLIAAIDILHFARYFLPILIQTKVFIEIPVMVGFLLIAYVYFWQTGDRLIEKYWRNPRIYYPNNGKPPYLKF
jgi:hypothetical protein